MFLLEEKGEIFCKKIEDAKNMLRRVGYVFHVDKGQCASPLKTKRVWCPFKSVKQEHNQ